jgi:hypothetical protein
VGQKPSAQWLEDLHTYNSGGSLNLASGDATSVAQFEFLPTPDNALSRDKATATFRYHGQPDACGAPTNTRLYFNNVPFAYTTSVDSYQSRK